MDFVKMKPRICKCFFLCLSYTLSVCQEQLLFFNIFLSIETIYPKHRDNLNPSDPANRSGVTAITRGHANLSCSLTGAINHNGAVDRWIVTVDLLARRHAHVRKKIWYKYTVRHGTWSKRDNMSPRLGGVWKVCTKPLETVANKINQKQGQ